MPNGICILIVEDNRNFRLDLQELFEFEGYDAVAAGDGAQALEVMKSHRVDVIVSDFDMPNMNGEELRQHIRAHAATAGMPFIMVSGQTPPEISDDSNYYFLQKPFDIQKLLALVERLTNVQTTGSRSE